jgi:hypothetical protein
MSKRRSIPELRQHLLAIANLLRWGDKPHLAQEIEDIVKEMKHIRRRQATTCR